MDSYFLRRFVRIETNTAISDDSYPESDSDLVSIFEQDPDVAATVVRAAAENETLLNEIFESSAVCAVLTEVCPADVSAMILCDSMDLLIDGSKGIELSSLFRWRTLVEDVGIDVPEALQTTSSVAEGVMEASERAKSLGKRNYLSSTMRVAAELSCDVARVVAATAFTALHPNRYGLEAEGARSEFFSAVRLYPEAWAPLLPWLLQVLGPDGTQIVEGTTLALSRDTVHLREAIVDATKHPIVPIAVRAQGLLGLIAGGGTDEALNLLTSLLARLSDRHRDEFPRPLAEPAQTWLSDMELEYGLHSAVDDAARAFGREFEAHGAAEEEGHVGSLMKGVERNLADRQRLRRVSGGLQPVDLVGSYRRVAKSEESTIGADLAIVISIDIGSRLKLTFADFVQVKKSHAENRALPSDRWRIDLEQLKLLLKTSATASYWLIAADGTILVVPAKLLYAKAVGTDALTQSTFTIHYADVRHAAVSLATYFTNLITGCWLGSADPDMLGLASGENARTTPHAVFEMEVRMSNQG